MLKGERMEETDYCVVVYKILNYLYKMLRDGRPVYCYEIQNDGSLFPIIKKNYWNTIINNLISNGYIFESETKFFADEKAYAEMKTYSISIKGIEYMYQNLSWINTSREMLDCRI